MVEDRNDSSPPFYTSLNIHDKAPHNCPMDSGTSHNFMPKIVMEELVLEIKKYYHDLYSFDLRRVQCLGVIKDLVLTLFQLLMKSVVMDIVVADVPPNFGMMLSIYCIKLLGGTLQMDLTYATIPVFGGEHRLLYREDQLAYIISDEAKPTNHPIFSFDTDLGSNLLQLSNDPEPPIEIRKKPIYFSEVPHPTTSMWKMFFDGASSREGVGAEVVFVSPCQETISLSYKLEIETTNNVAEYEALVLGLRATKDMGIEELTVFGDAELIVQQIINVYQAKRPWLKSYKNEVWDLVDNFFLAFNISFVPREENAMANYLVVSTNHFRIPLPPKIRYDVEIRYKPFVPNNMKHWKVFEDDLEIIIFLESRESFNQIKKALTKAPVLISPDYSKDFLIFSFSYFDIVAIVLLQKNDEGLEQPISFFSRALRDAKIIYDIMKKHAYALVKALKDFRVYVLHSKIITYVPSAFVKDILIHTDIDGRRGKWIAKILEFDLEIKPTKLVKGQVLAKLLAKSNCKSLGINFINTCSEDQQVEVSDKIPHDSPPLT
jgi:ribonuclease HI